MQLRALKASLQNLGISLADFQGTDTFVGMVCSMDRNLGDELVS